MKGGKLNLSFRKLVGAICFSGVLMFMWAGAGRGEMVVFDRVTAVEKDVRLIVLTKGFLMAEGGQLVDLYLDDQPLKRILTGGDGYGYLKFTPTKPGLMQIRARSDAGSATGLLLVMGQHDQAIIIDIENAFKDAVFSDKIMENSQRVVNALSKNYKLIYMSRYIGQGIGRSWLNKEGFPESVILSWQGPETFTVLQKRGVQLKAVIGSEEVVSAAEAEQIENRYTFDETTAGRMVKGWDEILSLLQPALPGEPEKKPCEKTTGVGE
jgi:hypothetical protein